MLFASFQRLVGLDAPTGAAAVLGVLLLYPQEARAGPPFRTDDPVPVEPGHWEVFTFSAATNAAGDTPGIFPALTSITARRRTFSST
jgi:hypothetical protein